MAFDLDSFGELIDNGGGSYTFRSADPDVIDVDFQIINPNDDVNFTGTVTFNGGVVFGSVYITPILTGNVDNYIIPDFKNYTTIVWRSDSDVDVKGIDATGLTGGNAWIFQNGNTNGKKFKFKMAQNSSLLNNRFAGKNDLTIEQDEFWWFKRNASTNRFIGQAKV